MNRKYIIITKLSFEDYTIKNNFGPHPIIKKADGLAGVINYVFGLNNFVLKEKPEYIEMHEEEIWLVELVRTFKIKYS